MARPDSFSSDFPVCTARTRCHLFWNIKNHQPSFRIIRVSLNHQIYYHAIFFALVLGKKVVVYKVPLWKYYHIFIVTEWGSCIVFFPLDIFFASVVLINSMESLFSRHLVSGIFYICSIYLWFIASIEGDATKSSTFFSWIIQSSVSVYFSLSVLERLISHVRGRMG